jgi:hypothetical protein
MQCYRCEVIPGLTEARHETADDCIRALRWALEKLAERVEWLEDEHQPYYTHGPSGDQSLRPPS